MSQVLPEQWVITPRRVPSANLRLFCFPYAGSGAAVFRGWHAKLNEAEVAIVNFPGRGALYNRPLLTCLDELVQVLADRLGHALDIPFAFFGHSLGALVSFELAHELRRRGSRQPCQLFVSSFRAPHLACRHSPIHALPDDEFFEVMCRRYRQIPQLILADEEFRSLVLPALRADFQVHETYVYKDKEPLDCDIAAFGGIDDHLVNESELAAWSSHTKENFRLETFQGDHFYIVEDPEPLLMTMRARLEALSKNPDGNPF